MSEAVGLVTQSPSPRDGLGSILGGSMLTFLAAAGLLLVALPIIGVHGMHPISFGAGALATAALIFGFTILVRGLLRAFRTLRSEFRLDNQ